MGFSGCRTSLGWAVLTWGPFSVVIGLVMAADVALVVENELNGVLISNRRSWERWGDLPGGCSMMVVVGKRWVVCGDMAVVVGGRKAVTWQRLNQGFRIRMPRAAGPPGGHIID